MIELPRLLNECWPFGHAALEPLRLKGLFSQGFLS